MQDQNLQTVELPIPCNSLDVASLIARLCHKRNYHYNNTKIQKLLYCCYGSVLAVFGQRLCDEYPRAWQYGPVFPRVFNYIKKRKGDIALYHPDFSLPDELRALLEKVIDIFGKYDAVPLSKWTHKPGSPWDTVVNQLDGEGGGLNNFIPDDLIANYFKSYVLTGEANA